VGLVILQIIIRSHVNIMLYYNEKEMKKIIRSEKSYGKYQTVTSVTGQYLMSTVLLSI
jgi:hypothetical protein